MRFAAFPRVLISAFRRLGILAFSSYAPSLALGVLIALAPVAIAAEVPTVETYRLRKPDSKGDINQASDLCVGRLGRHDGLWIAPDRNSGDSGNQIFLIDRDRLARLKPGDDAVATRAFPTTGPAQGWERFMTSHSRIDRAILTELRGQFENSAHDRTPTLDFEGITIAPRLSEPRAQASRPNSKSLSEPRARASGSQHNHDRPQTGAASRTAAWPVAGALGSDHTTAVESLPSMTPDLVNASLWVVTEQPNSIVLEFALIDDAQPRLALADCFFYPEKPEERGGDANDGIEGIAWAGRPGQFFICEEGTRPHRAGDSQHFFDQPRMMRCTLDNGLCHIEEPWSMRATDSVRSQHDKPSQTLNALTQLDDRMLVAVDRNGGWILAIDISTGQARRWVNLYDPKLLNLRDRLATFPNPRNMPYVSIEGIAIDDHGDLWLCDDPAMPEGFRESCLIRVKYPPPPPR